MFVLYMLHKEFSKFQSHTLVCNKRATEHSFVHGTDFDQFFVTLHWVRTLGRQIELQQVSF